MSVLDQRVGPPLLALGGLLGAFAVGALLALRVSAGEALLAGALFVPLVMIDVSLGIAIWIPALLVYPGIVTSLMGIAIAAAWIGSLIRLRLPLREVLPGQRVLVGVFALLLMWLGLSVLWSRDPHVSWDELRGWLIAAGALIVVATTTTTPARLRLVLMAFVLGMLLSVSIGLLKGQVPTRFGGAEGNPDDLAAQLLPAIVLSGALIADRRGVAERVALAACMVILTLALVATQSRGGLVAGVGVVFAAVVIYRRQPRHLFLALGLILAVAGTWFALSPAAFDRVTSFGDGGAGRTTLWAVAWRVAADHVPVGVGLNNFRIVSQDYVRRPDLLRYVSQIESRHVVHNTYLELLAETGVPGLALFLVAVVGALGAAHRAATRFSRARRPELARLALGVMLAGISVLAAQMFQSNGHDTGLWILLALGPAMLTMSGAEA